MIQLWVLLTLLGPGDPRAGLWSLILDFFCSELERNDLFIEKTLGMVHQGAVNTIY